MSTKPSHEPPAIIQKHPVIANALIIIIIAALGLFILYFSLAIFTKHGQSDKVPKVENMSYTTAIQMLNDKGFQVDIRDSLYKDDVKPGYVIEQFPKAGSIVKPGRKIFLYINAVHPKEVVIDDDNHPMDDALRGYSYRSGMAKLQELGFKNIRVVKVLGDNDCIVKLLANGVPVKKMQKVPVNASIVMQVYDGRLAAIRDSLQNEELMHMPHSESNGYGGYGDDYGNYGGGGSYGGGYEGGSTYSPSSEGQSTSNPNTAPQEEEIEYY